MGKKKQSSVNLGRTLIKDRFGGKAQRSSDSHLHTSELEDGTDWNRINLQSITEQNTLDEFLATAEIAGTEFQAERLNVKIVNSEKHTGLLTYDEQKTVRQAQDENKNLLRIPRRPAWTAETTPEELDRMEKDDFLEWRRQLAELQEVEGILMTPFERNLDFWRQLWRVLERSDVVVQIVDARNPLLFRCLDLESYVHEINKDKINMILINKADFLTKKQRQYWADYFNAQNIRVAFWSAVAEAEKQQQLLSEQQTSDDEQSPNDDSSESESERESDDNETTTDLNIHKATLNNDHDDDTDVLSNQSDDVDKNDSNTTDTLQSSDVTSQTAAEQSQQSCNDDTATLVTTSGGGSDGDVTKTKCLNDSTLMCGDELIELLKSLHNYTSNEKQLTTIGLVGYPNVGKSSTINSLLQNKKVPVSATPGRTKHFQTLFLDEHLMLCDCPGLVMPMFVSTKAEMIVSGILPVDQMRDYVQPISLICRDIPREVLQATYGIMIPKPRVEDGEDANRFPTAIELLTSYACMRGYMSHKGVPDYQRSARNILKDYITGKVLYCYAPEGVSSDNFECAAPSVKPVKLNKAAHHTVMTALPSSIDSEFFEQSDSRVGSRGVFGVINYARRQGYMGHQSGATEPGHRSNKPWKKHGNAKKKQKLRRVTAHLDVNT